MFAASIDKAQSGEEKKKFGIITTKCWPAVVSSQGTERRFCHSYWRWWHKQCRNHWRPVWWVQCPVSPSGLWTSSF